MKNLLSENMLRFGTKNLSEAAQRELVLKSIMETINEHGLQGAVRRRLTESDEPKNPQAWIEFDAPNLDKYKQGAGYGEILVIQSPSSLGEASKILGEMLKAIGTDNEEGTKMQSLIKQITFNNYPALLWKLRNGDTFRTSNSFKKNFHTLGSWLGNYINQPTTSNVGTGTIGSGGKGPIGGLRDFILGTKTAEVFNSHMATISKDEYIRSYNPS